MEFPNTTQVIEEFATVIKNDWRDLMEVNGYSKSPLKQITFNIKENDQIYVIKFRVPDYFWYFEKGRGPGKMPPIKPIKNWIIKYNIIPQPRTMPNGKTYLPTTDSLAFLIARSIGKKGTKGKHWWEPLLERIISDYEIKIQEAIQADMNISLEDEFNDIPDTIG